MSDLQKTVQFLYDLSENNKKEWMDANRDTYTMQREEFKEFCTSINERLCKIDPEMKMIEPKRYLFRINRDIRFSKDKSPYKPHFSAAFVDIGKKTERPGYYLRIDRFGDFWIGGGWYGMEAEALSNFRKDIPDTYKSLDKLMNDKKIVKHFGGIKSEKMLKRYPNGFEKDKEYSHYFLYKEFFLMTKLKISSKTYEELLKDANKLYKLVYPVVSYFRQY